MPQPTYIVSNEDGTDAQEYINDAVFNASTGDTSGTVTYEFEMDDYVDRPRFDDEEGYNPIPKKGVR